MAFDTSWAGLLGRTLASSERRLEPRTWGAAPRPHARVWLLVRRARAVDQAAQPADEIAHDVGAGGCVLLLRLQRFADQPLLEELAAGGDEVICQEQDRLRRCSDLGTPIRGESDCPFAQLVDLPVVHGPILACRRRESKVGRADCRALSRD